jgi:drug/metabolite transporter (DMT)-like permease
MTFVIFAWLGSFLYGIEVVTGKLISKYSISNPFLFGFIQTFMYVCLIVPIALLAGAGTPKNFGLVLALAAGRATSNILYYLSLYKVDLTILSPMFNARMIFSVLLAFIFLGEDVSAVKIGLIGLILIGGVLVNIEEKMKLKSFLTASVLLMLCMTFAIAVNDILTNRSIDANNYWTSILWSETLSLVFLSPAIKFFYKDLKVQVSKKSMAVTFLVAAITTIAGLATFKALSENVGITSVIMAIPFSMMLTLVLSAVKPNLLEKHTVKIYAIRIFAAAIMITSAFILSVLE